MVTQKLHNFVDSTVKKLKLSYDFDVYGDSVNNLMKPNAVFARNQRHVDQSHHGDVMKFIHGDRVFFEDFVDMVDHYIDIDIFTRLDEQFHKFSRLELLHSFFSVIIVTD